MSIANAGGRRGVLVGFALALSALAAACGRDAAARDSQGLDVKVSEVSDSSLVTAPHPERFPVSDVVTQMLPDRLSGTCVVTPDVSRTVPVNALAGGRVVDLKARLGDAVQRGQVLLTISSPDLSSALADYLKAMADEALAKKQLDRSAALYAHGSIAQKDLEAAQGAEQKAQVDVRTTEDHVRMLGGDPTHPAPTIELRAPVTGTIIEQNVTPSAGVKSPDNAPNLFTVADLSRVWVVCDVYENDLSRVHVGQVAHIRLTADPSRPFAGQISKLSPLLDSSTRTAKVRVELANESKVMKPGMFATAELESTSLASHLTVPATAIVQTHDGDWVFVKAGPTTFRRVHVQTGGETQPGVQAVLAGLSPGQQVVRNALQFMQSLEQQ